MTMTVCASWVVASSATAMGMCGHAVVPARRIPSVQLLKHTTHWHHPKYFSTTVGYRGGRLVYKTNEEIRAIAPDAFQS